MTAQRVRLSALADELGVDFVELFRHLCAACPDEIADDLTVGGRWRGIFRAFQDGRIVA